MQEHRSFFQLTIPRPEPDADNPLRELTGEEFEAACAEAQPLFEALVATVNAYSETHPHLRLMAISIAADMLRDMLKQDLWEEGR